MNALSCLQEVIFCDQYAVFTSNQPEALMLLRQNSQFLFDAHNGFFSCFQDQLDP